MISSKSDARVESVDIYDDSDLYENPDVLGDELGWAFTGEENRAYRGEFFLPLTDEEMDYWENKSERWFESTRSTAARNSLHFWIDDWHMEEEGMRGTFEGRSLQNHIEVKEGDEIFRILAYEEDDRLSARDVRSRADEIVQEGEYRVGENVLTDDNTLEVAIDRRLALNSADTSFSDLESDRDQYISTDGRDFGNGADADKFELLETVPVSMPDDLFGRIKDTSIKGHSYHLSSTFIDPGYEGTVIVEVAAPTNSPLVSKEPEYLPGWGEDMYIEMELYESTEL